MSDQNNAFDFLAKILMIGNTGVGKTCLLLRFSENSFTMDNLVTIGIDFKMKILDIDDKRIKVEIWDTSGQERYQTLTQSFYRGSKGIILTYSVTDLESFKRIGNWMEDINRHVSGDACKILIGNKCDMPNRMVSYEEGKRLADSYGIQFFETSAKEGLNVDDAFKLLAKEVKEKFYDKADAEPPIVRDKKLSVMPKTETQKSNCC